MRAGSLYGVRVGVCPGVRLAGWLRWSAHPFVVLCAGGMRSALLLLLALQKWQLVFLVFLYLVIHNLPQLHMHTVIFSPVWFLCILVLKETFAQVQALQQKVPDPSLSHSPLRDSTPLILKG